MIRSVGLLTIAVILSLLTACVLPDFGAFLKDGNGNGGGTQTPPPVDQREITISAEQITLQWDPPPEAVARYDVYYRNHDASGWTVIGTANAVAQPAYTVLHSTLGNGMYDFAVVAVTTDGDSSDYHTSLDPTAQPGTGWYLVWSR